jgi:hypothetical protein
LSDAFRRLPTNTHTFIGFSMVIFHYDVFVRSETGSLHSSAGGQGSNRPQQETNHAGM